MKVSVLMATYNGEKYVKTQIDSLLNQSYKEFDIYISDDGSKDKTLEILNEYEKKYSNIHVLSQHSPNGSACKNFLYLLNNVDSELYLFCDQDDEWFSDHIENLVKAYEKESDKSIPLLIHSDLEVVDGNLNTINPSFFDFSGLSKNPLNYRYYLVQNNVTGCTMCINQALKEKCLIVENNDIKLIPMHDWWFALVAARFGKVVFLESKGLRYRQHGNNEVGAKNVNSLSYMFSRFFNKTANKASVEMSRNLVSVFVSVFKGELIEEEVLLLTEYISPEKYSKLHRIAFLRKNGFKRDSFKRRVMQILYI